MIAMFFLGIWDNALLALDVHGTDLHFDTDNNFKAFAYFVMSCNHFLPITDAYLPILGIYLGVYAFFLALKLIGSVSIAGFSFKF